MTANAMNVSDRLDRPLRDLRISVTDRCNFRCGYCMPEEVFGPDFPFLKGSELLGFDEMTRLARLFASLGVEKIRITGGEPLLRPDLPALIRAMKTLVPDVSLTTNGSLLARQATALREAGLERINVSLDSLDEERFRRMNGGRCDVGTVLKGIEAAAAAGLRVKVNMVVRKGMNDVDVLPMARFFRGTGHIVRFIEFMDVGNFNGWSPDDVVSKRDIVRMIDEVMPLEPIGANYRGEVASRYRYRHSDEEIGVVSSVTDTFCSDCNRARLSASGVLYTCLFAARGTDLRSLVRSIDDDERLREAIADVWRGRRDRYSEERTELRNKPDRPKIEMFYIGG